jgi:F0F1-type ATP synthase delta subunit
MVEEEQMPHIVITYHSDRQTFSAKVFGEIPSQALNEYLELMVLQNRLQVLEANMARQAQDRANQLIVAKSRTLFNGPFPG